MTKFNNILLNVLFSTCPFLFSAQELTVNEEKEIARFSDGIIISSNFTPGFAHGLDLSDPALPASVGNNIFITQTGTNNNINANIFSQDGIVELEQAGERNNVQMKIDAAVVQGVVIQNGSDNQIFDYVPSSNQPVLFYFKKEGNNHHIESYGSNSISNGLKVELEGNSKAIIIRNFNFSR